MRSVVSSQLIFFNSSENIFLLFKLSQIVCQLGCAEVWTTHGAVLTVCMTCLLEILQGKLWVEREVELVSPAELEAGLGEGVVADGCTWMTLCLELPELDAGL